MAYYSHSKLDSFLQCPRKFWYKYIAKIDSKDNGIEAYMGTHVHSVLEKYFKDAKIGQAQDMHHYLRMFKDLFWGNLGPHIFIVMEDKTQQFYYERGLNCIYDFFAYNIPPKEGDKRIHLEYNVKIPINGGKDKLTGYIDYLLIDGETAVIEDYKSGKKVPTYKEAAEHVQLSIYDYAIRKLFPDVKKIELRLYYLLHNKRFITFRTPEDNGQTEVYMRETVLQIEQATKDENFPCQESFLCNWCTYQPQCPVFNKEAAKA